MVVPSIVAQAGDHFDPAAFEKYLRWRLIYLARHARIADPEAMFVLRGKTSRELDAWVWEASEMLKAEVEQGKKAAAERR
jgi:hypothetical protein